MASVTRRCARRVGTTRELFKMTRSRSLVAQRIWIVAARTPVITPRAVYGGTPLQRPPYDSAACGASCNTCNTPRSRRTTNPRFSLTHESIWRGY